MADVEFQTIQAEEIKFGRNNFLEVARKRAVVEDGNNEFIAISRGFFMPDGTKRFRRSLALPDEGEIIDFVVKQLQTLHREKPKESKPEAHNEEKPAEAATPEEAK